MNRAMKAWLFPLWAVLVTLSVTPVSARVMGGVKGETRANRRLGLDSQELKLDLPIQRRLKMGMGMGRKKSMMGMSMMGKSDKSMMSMMSSKSMMGKSKMSSKSMMGLGTQSPRPSSITSFPSFVPPTSVAPGTPTGAPTTVAPGTPTATPSSATPGTTSPTISTTTASPGTTPPPTPVTTTANPGATPATGTPGTTSPTGVSTTRAECTLNPQDYNVNIDIQITFEENIFAACDSAEQDAAINTNIQAALNDNFLATVTDWAGTATFDTFFFDPEQEVNNVDPFARRRNRRQLRLTAENEAPAQQQSTVFIAALSRTLQEATCPSRAEVDCTVDYCRWGCVTASTTDCGDPASTTDSWTNLANDIQTRLAGLGFDCLGIPAELQVVLIVDEPTTAETAARSFNPNSPVRTINLNDVDTTTADESIRIIPVASKLEFHFFPQQGREPTTTEITALQEATISFFQQEFRNSTKFSSIFKDFEMTQITPQYSAATDPDAFVMEFLAEILVDSTNSQDVSGKDALDVMSSSSYKEYIGDFVREPGAQWSEFYQTHTVHFTGVSHAR